jgi:hypothetical protein
MLTTETYRLETEENLGIGRTTELIYPYLSVMRNTNHYRAKLWFVESPQHTLHE